MKIELVLGVRFNSTLLGSKCWHADLVVVEFLNQVNFSALRVICYTPWNKTRHTIRIPRNGVDRGLYLLEREESVLH